MPEAAEDFTAADNIFLGNAYDCSWFLTAELVFLNRRGQTLAELVRTHKLLGGETLDRRQINDAASAEPVTARQLVKLDIALDAIARSPKAAVRAFLDGSDPPLEIAPKSVVASLYWVDRLELREALARLKVSGSAFGMALFGNAGHARSFFGYIEDGVRRGAGSARYDYRVGVYTADELMFGLEVLQQLRVAEGQPVGEAVSFNRLFSASHTAGAHSGKKTIALPIQNGNRVSPISDVEKKAAVVRIKKLASGAV